MFHNYKAELAILVLHNLIIKFFDYMCDVYGERGIQLAQVLESLCIKNKKVKIHKTSIKQKAINKIN